MNKRFVSLMAIILLSVLLYTVSNAESASECFERYQESLFQISTEESAPVVKWIPQNVFSEDGQLFYDFLKQCITETASGQRTSTVFVTDIPFTLDEAEQSRLIAALLSDCPYELYWYDKIAGYSVSEEEGKTVLRFTPHQEFSDGPYTLDTSKVERANTAVANANSIIAKYAQLSDYEKLKAYKDEICGLVSYAHNASYASEGSAWQLISVFDGDDTTNVQCEGYAKAFQYLCDQSEFSSDIRCYSVGGIMTCNQDTTEHMWNIVRMSNGKCYLADLTNCDTGTIGSDDQLFLAGVYYRNSETRVCYRCVQGDTVYILWYEYDSLTTDLFSLEDLAISDNAYLYDAASPEELVKGSLKYKIIDGKAIITGYENLEVEELDIPASIDGAPVTEIGRSAFSWCSALKTVRIPGSVETIAYQAFSNCEDLVNVYTENGLKYIEDSAFTDCRFSEFSIPDTCVSIGTGAFMTCLNLESIVIPGSVHTISPFAFAYCRGLKSAVIEDEVSSIERAAFSWCTSLVNISIPDSIVQIDSEAFANCENLTQVSIPGKSCLLGDTVFVGCNSLVDVSVSEESPYYKNVDGVLMDQSAEFIYLYPAARQGSVYSIPVGVDGIAAQAFDSCRYLEEVYFPDGFQYLDYMVFSQCKKLTAIHFPKTLIYGGFFSIASLFEECTNLGSISVDPEHPDLSSSDGVLYNKDMTELLIYPAGKRDSHYTVPEGVEQIGYESFRYNPYIESVTLPKSLKTIQGYAFSDCKELNAVSVPDSLMEIQSDAFMNCSKLSDFDIPSGITCINEGIFYGCKCLKSIRIPSGVTCIGRTAFMLSGLERLYLPDTLTSIEEAAFLLCPLAEVYYEGSLEQWNRIDIDSLNNDALYEATIFTNEYAAVTLRLPYALTMIDDEAFVDCGAERVQLPDKLVSIGARAFKDNAQLTWINIPESVESIGDDAFTGCPELQCIVAAGSFAERYCEQNNIRYIIQ